MIQRGDSVRYFDETGFNAAPATQVDDESVTVFTLDGEYRTFLLKDVQEVSDGRMTRLRELDEQDPAESAEVRERYLTDWIRRVVVFNEGPSVPTADRQDKQGRTKASSLNGEIDTLLTLLRESPHMLARVEIMEKTGWDEALYNKVIRVAKSSKTIVHKGNRRSTVYGAKGKTYQERPELPMSREKAAQKAPDGDLLSQVVETLKEQKKPLSRSEIFAEVSITNDEWNLISKSLRDGDFQDKVRVTGNRRSTRYEWVGK